jgi:hypothetical protein
MGTAVGYESAKITKTAEDGEERSAKITENGEGERKHGTNS